MIDKNKTRYGLCFSVFKYKDYICICDYEDLVSKELNIKNPKRDFYFKFMYLLGKFIIKRNREKRELRAIPFTTECGMGSPKNELIRKILKTKKISMYANRINLVQYPSVYYIKQSLLTKICPNMIHTKGKTVTVWDVDMYLWGRLFDCEIENIREKADEIYRKYKIKVEY